METYLTIVGLGEYLKISEKTVRKWVLNQSIPYRKILGVIRFRLSEIEKWIDDGCLYALTAKAVGGDGELIQDKAVEEEATFLVGGENNTANADGGVA